MVIRVRTPGVRRGSWAAAVTATLVVTVASVGWLGAGSPATAATDRGGYLALGDSVSFGYEPPEVTPVEDYFNPANFKGYPEYLAQVTGLRLSNASCPGETAASMIDVSLPSYACQTPDGYRTNFPLHVSYPDDQSQLQYAVRYLQSHTDTRLVTLTIGANDVFLCQATTDDGCVDRFPTLLQQIGTNLATILKTLRSHYTGPLVLLTYYAEDYADPTMVAGIQALNQVLSATANTFGATVADGFGAFKLATIQRGGDACAAGLLIALPDGTCNIHPSARGDWILTASVAVASLRASASRQSAVALESAVEATPPAQVQSAVEQRSPELQSSLD